jgi:8-oxo-dGTP pyrophosphatase MutT (NUDIX family)
MDISYTTDNSKFNYRVCALFISDGRVLAMRDERSPYYYLPGGRVKLGETAEQAILREIGEELNVPAKILRPLWLNQGFFTEDVDGMRYHELCVYFLMETPPKLSDKSERFTMREGLHVHDFEWLSFERLKDEYFYPIFLKSEIFHLPDTFTLRTEYE